MTDIEIIEICGFHNLSDIEYKEIFERMIKNGGADLDYLIENEIGPFYNLSLAGIRLLFEKACFNNCYEEIIKTVNDVIHTKRWDVAYCLYSSTHIPQKTKELLEPYAMIYVMTS